MPSMYTMIVDNGSKKGVLAQVKSRSKKRVTATLSNVSASGTINSVYGKIISMPQLREQVGLLYDGFAHEAEQNLGKDTKKILVQLSSKAAKSYDLVVSSIEGNEEKLMYGCHIPEKNFAQRNEDVVNKFKDLPAVQAVIKNFIESIK